MVNLKKLDLDKIPFNQAYNQISKGFIQANTINDSNSLLFGNGYELMEMIGDKDLLELILKRHSKENICGEDVIDLNDKYNQEIIKIALENAKKSYKNNISYINEQTEKFEKDIALISENKCKLISFVEYLIASNQYFCGFESDMQFYFNCANITKYHYLDILESIDITSLKLKIIDTDDEYTFRINFTENNGSVYWIDFTIYYA